MRLGHDRGDDTPPAGEDSTGSAAADPAPTPISSRRGLRGSRRVLVVDDDPAVRDVIVGMLPGHTVIQAGDGDEALAKLDEEPVDAILLDIAMPRVDGIEALHRIRRHPKHRDTSVVLLTARTDESHHLRGWLAGADAYVTKPFDDEAITSALNEVLDRTPEIRESVRQTERQRAALLRQLESRFS